MAANGELVLSLARMRAHGPGRSARQHGARRGGRGHGGGARALRAARAHLAGRLRVEGLEHRRRQHRHQRGRREGDPLRAHAPVGARPQVVLAERRRCWSSNGALEKNNTGVDLRQLFIGSEGTLGIITEATLKLARAAERARRLALRRRRISPRVLASSARRGARPFVLCRLRVLHRRVPRRASPPPQAAPAARAAVDPLRARRAERRARRERSSRGSRRSSSAGLVRDGVLAQHAREAAELWALREGDQRVALAPRACRTRTTSRCPSPRWRRSARRSTPLFAAPLPRLGDLPLRPHRRRQPPHQRDEAGRRSTRPRSSRGQSRPTTNLRRSCASTTAASPPSTASAC